jgi:hypothetical protein
MQAYNIANLLQLIDKLLNCPHDRTEGVKLNKRSG